MVRCHEATERAGTNGSRNISPSKIKHLRRKFPLIFRDKKGLLKDNREPEETLRPDKKHKEFEYNKTTGIITGRHSAV